MTNFSRGESEPIEGYDIYTPESDESLKKIINTRRGPSQSVPGLSIEIGCELGDVMFSKFNIPHLVGCVTAEMAQRPVPEVFREEETRPITDLYEKWAPLIYQRVLPEIQAPIQTFNKTSRLGWPIFKATPNKVIALMPFFRLMGAGDFNQFIHAFIIMNVRLQAESKEKVRQYLFYNSGEIRRREITASDRAVTVEGLGTRTCSRTRLVFNMPVPNLWKQVLDTAIHNVFMNYSTFHHDMFGGKVTPVRNAHMAFDVKHFERHTAAIVRRRAQLFGGYYGKIVDIFAKLPFAVPSSDWKERAFIYPARDRGWSDQFASGDSAVAPAQKEVFTALYAEFFTVAFGYSMQEALNLVFLGGNEKLTIRNYGDDNSVNGDPAVLEDLFTFLKQYLTVEKEEPAKFLGFVHYPDLGWKLPVESYLSKTYLNERRPNGNFRKFPNLGWVLKRQTFAQIGHPDVAKDVFPYEDAELAKRGLPWSKIMERAEVERIQSMGSPGVRNPNYVMGKDYIMTAEEKIATGEHVGLMPNDTAPIIKKLLGSEWNSKLRW